MAYFCLVIGIVEKIPHRDLHDASLSFSYQEQSFVTTWPFSFRSNLVNRAIEIYGGIFLPSLVR